MVVVSLVRNVRIYLAFCRSMETTVNEWVVIRELREIDRATTVYFFTGAYMLADSPAFELFRGGRRHVFGITEADLPERLAEPTAFILAPDYRGVGRSLTERFPDLERQLIERRGVRLLTIYRCGTGNATGERAMTQGSTAACRDRDGRVPQRGRRATTPGSRRPPRCSPRL